MLYPPKCKLLTQFKWQKKQYFQRYVQDAIMIQAENIISLTEFSNNKNIHDFSCLHSMMKVSMHLQVVCVKRTS